MARHLESKLQQNCIFWFRLQYPDIGKLCFAVPNGGSRSLSEARIMKGEGITAGVSDLVLLIAKGPYSALCIEMKAPDGKQTELQASWQQLAEKHGNKYVVCRSFDEFRSEINNYLSHI